MIDTFTSPLDWPTFVDNVLPDNLKRRDPDELQEWVSNRMKDRIQRIKEEAENEEQ